jgi:alkylation response protein AidB-like acyl-CoA dehydrogenase
MAAGVRALLDQVPDGGIGLAISHTPLVTRNTILKCRARSGAQWSALNEVFFQDYFVPHDMMVGGEGQGWSMVTEELAFERSGPDRYLSDYRLLVELIDRVGRQANERQAVEIGRLVGHLAALQRMSASVAGLLDRGTSPNVEAALVKDVGTAFERELPEIARRLIQVEASLDDPGDPLSETLAHVVLHAPSFTLRGGTREILRGIIARGLGLR